MEPRLPVLPPEYPHTHLWVKVKIHPYTVHTAPYGVFHTEVDHESLVFDTASKLTAGITKGSNPINV